MKILFLVPYPSEGPSNRYRVEQYLPYLEKAGIEYCLRPFISSDFFKILHKPGNRLRKMFYFLSSTRRRLADLINVSHFDMVFVHIEAFPFGPAIFEWLFSKMNKPIIYDFEDAVYLPDFRRGNKFLQFIRNPSKFYQIINLSSQVIVCNKYMRDFVSRYNPNVTIIPTSIDTEKFTLKNFKSDKRIVIGWIGSCSTSIYLKPLVSVFQQLRKKYDFILKITGAGRDFDVPGLNIVKQDWSLPDEVKNFQDIDIGIYPLPNDERALAKTPFKTIQYLSVGVASVVSKVGANVDIIKDGTNGFLAEDENEWIEKISALIENPDMRMKMGLAGRKAVEEKYSLSVNAPKFLKVIQDVYLSTNKG